MTIFSQRKPTQRANQPGGRNQRSGQPTQRADRLSGRSIRGLAGVEWLAEQCPLGAKDGASNPALLQMGDESVPAGGCFSFAPAGSGFYNELPHHFSKFVVWGGSLKGILDGFSLSPGKERC